MIQYLFTSNCIELICFFAALICLIKDKDVVWRSMIFFTLMIFAIETWGIYLKINKQPNQLPYNFILLLYGAFMSMIFDHFISPYLKSRAILLVMLSIFILSFGYETFQKGFIIFHNVTYTILSVSYILVSLFYFTLLLKDEGYIKLSTSASFWWVAGTLIFYFGSIAVILFRGKLLIKVNDHYFLTHYINIALNLLLYGCWSYAFICRKWITRSTRSYS